VICSGGWKSIRAIGWEDSINAARGQGPKALQREGAYMTRSATLLIPASPTRVRGHLPPFLGADRAIYLLGGRSCWKQSLRRAPSLSLSIMLLVKVGSKCSKIRTGCAKNLYHEVVT